MDKKLRRSLPAIDRVIVWQNGVVMVFDAHGEQIPEYQGVWEERKADILDVFTGEVEHGIWNDMRR